MAAFLFECPLSAQSLFYLSHKLMMDYALCTQRCGCHPKFVLIVVCTERSCGTHRVSMLKVPEDPHMG